VFGTEELEAVENLKRALSTLDAYDVTYFDDHEVLIDALREQRPDLVLNLCDVGFRNQWERELDLPALLHLLGIPYTGADPTAIVLSNDKSLMSAAAKMRGVRVPLERLLDPRGEELPDIFPALIKPNVSAGSAGITEKSVVHDRAEAAAYVRDNGGDTELLMQEFLPGTEYTVGVIGNPGADFLVLPPLAIDYGALDDGLPPILTHGSKADPDSTYWDKLVFVQAELDDAKHDGLARDCRVMFERLGLRDYARFDFREGVDDEPRLIDANVNPTWYEGGKMCLMAGWAGHDYAAMLRLILEAAATRVGLS